MLTITQRMKLLDLLNKGRDESLRSLPGVGETRLEAIKKARPFNDITEVTQVPGVGEGTFIDFVKHAKAGFPKRRRSSCGQSFDNSTLASCRPHASLTPQ